MKIKVTPEDFLVSEVQDLKVIQTKGRYRVYSLEKRQWETLDLINFLAKRFHVSPQNIAVGGFKDRYGKTSQIITIKSQDSLPYFFSDKNLSLTPLGYTDKKISAKDIRGNVFDIVIRDISPQEFTSILKNCAEVKRYGFPNYYDEQRFGSARHKQGFMGKEIFLGRREQALKLFFWPSKHDRKQDKAFKKCIIKEWERWERCLDIAPQKYRKIVEFLCMKGHRHSFTKALPLIDRRYLMFSLHAYQSFLFNQILVNYIIFLNEKTPFPWYWYPYSFGKIAFYHELPEHIFSAIKSMKLPVPGHNSLIEDKDVRGITKKILFEEGITLKDLKVKNLYKIAVGGVERRMVVLPEGIEILGSGEDELYPTKSKCRIRFFLPRGSYATILIKRLALTD